MSRYKIDPYLFSKNEKLILKALKFCKTPLSISKETNIPRPTVYFVLDKLKTRGLVIIENYNKKKSWKLKGVEKNDIGNNIENNVFKIYKGKESVLDFLYTLITHNAHKFQSLNGDHNISSWNKNIGSELITKLNNLIKDNDLISDFISSNLFIEENKKLLGEKWVESIINKPTEYHLINSKYTNFKSQIILQDGKIFLVNMEKLIVFEISNLDMFKCFESIFEFIKDHTENIRLGDVLNTDKR